MKLCMPRLTTVPADPGPARIWSEAQAMMKNMTPLAHCALSALLIIGMATSAVSQTSSQKASVQLSAAVQASPARITLAWTSLPSTTSITIYRKALTATTWGNALASPGASALNYADNSVSVGTAYEYKVVRVAAGVTGTGYISSGIAVPPVDYRGRMILLVDNTFSSSLSSELTTLQSDLRMDGWSLVRVDLPRTASIATVKSTVVSQYNANPSQTKALFIVGHLAVPYSGNINPDGHSEHLGAWPCDGYYGEMNGTWTDNSVNNNASQRPANRNIPGDGKFDQSNFPSDVELQVGRVDFYDMPAFALNETELLRNYLNKAHGFKMKYWTPTARGLVFDNLQWVSNPLAASAWRNLAPTVGPANITAANQYAAPFHQLVDEQSYLWTYSSGGGAIAYEGSTLTYNGADLVGTTQNFASASSHWGVFNMSFGSNFGDWDNKNNFLRAPLASGYALTNCWAAIPAWYFHHMGMGANIGQSTLTSMNNASVFTPLTDGWQSTIGRVHLGLMGDPSLRQKMLVSPSNLAVTNAGGYAAFAWSPSTETVDGYHLYAINGSTGAITRITTSIVTGTTYTSTVPFVAGNEYMVRATRLITEPSGSYYNLSLGSAAFAAGATAPDCAGVAGGSALPGTACNDGNACTTNDTWNSSCQCVGTGGASTPTITASGATVFCTGGSVVLSTGTGSGYTYQWKRNGTNISGATTSSYTVSTAGTYTIVVSASGCSNTSAGVVITVGTLPTATITAGGPTTFCSGGSVTLTANSGSGYTYQWKLNGTNISGATSQSYSATQAGGYTVVVSSGGCNRTSSTMTTSLVSGPTLSCSASPSNSTVSVSVTSGTGPYTYAWNTNPINTTATATVPASGSYTVSVQGANGCTSTCTVSITLATVSSCSGFVMAAQGTWGANATQYNLSGSMVATFGTAYPAPNYLTIGCGSRLMRFTSGAAIIAALPTYGTPAMVPSGTTTNPTNLTNTLIGQLVAAKLNVRYDAINANFAPYQGMLGSLVITSGTFAGWTFQQLIDAADQRIGGCSSTYSLSALSNALTTINNGYDQPGENVGYLTCPGSSGMMIPDEPVREAPAEVELEVLVYPVPVIGQATILLSEIQEDSEITIDLLNIAGASQGVLFSGRVEAGVQKSIAWNADGLAPGSYVCRVIIGDRVLSRRIVVQ
jgi:hypothetical protein